MIRIFCLFSLVFFCVFVLSGCIPSGRTSVEKAAVSEEIQAGSGETAPSPAFSKTGKSGRTSPRSEKELMEMEMAQLKAVVETALEISKNAEKYAQEAYNTSNQANATAEKSLEASNKAIDAAAEAVKASNEAAEKAITAANEASEKAIAAADKSAKEAMEHADQAAQKATDAANEAINASNSAAEKAITAANKALAASDQVMAELGRTKATAQAKELEPVLPEEPRIVPTRTYRVKPGDTLRRISKKVYGTESNWQKIYQANKNKIKNPNILLVGIDLVVP
jgi:nucleoid-associated protein YgaU